MEPFKYKDIPRPYRLDNIPEPRRFTEKPEPIGLKNIPMPALPEPAAPVFTNAYSLEFDGLSNSLDIGDISSIAASQSEFSYSIWFKLPCTGAGTHGILGSSGKIEGEVYYINTLLSHGISVNNFSENRPHIIGTVSVDTWNHMVITFNSGTTKRYLNGVKVSEYVSTTYTSTHASLFNDLSLGACRRFNEYGNVKIDEFAVFQKELTESDVSGMYNSGTPANLSDYEPDGWWRMEEGSGTIVADSSGNGGNDATVNGAIFTADTPPSSPAQVPFQGNLDGLSFDNVDDVAKATSPLTLSKDAAWSFSFWFNIINPTSDYDNTRDFMSGGRSRFRIVQNLAGTSSTVRFYDDSGWRVGTHDTTAFNFNNSWNHILVTSDGTNAVRMYINGIQQNGGTGILLSDVSLIGANLYVVGNQQYSGKARAFDEIAVFNSDLSSNAVDMYNGGTPTDLAPYNPLIWWRMEQSTGCPEVVQDLGTDGDVRRDLHLYNLAAAINGVIQTEAADFLQVEAGQFLAFE